MVPVPETSFRASHSNQTRTKVPLMDHPSVPALVKNDFLMRSLSSRPHRDQVVTSRPAELTMLQAIDLANGAILSKYLSEGANNLKAKASDSDTFINWLYEHTLGRLPTSGNKK